MNAQAQDTAGETLHVEPTADENGMRVDVCLASHVASLSRSHVGRLAQEGAVTLDGRPVKASHRVQTGESFVVALSETAEAELQAQEIPLSVVFEDEYLLVVDKPRDMVVHPAPGNEEGTLVNALLKRGHSLSTIGGDDRPGIVHRLDRHTSGVMVVAKDDDTHAALKSQLADRAMKKEYRALVNGVPAPLEGRIETAMDRHPRNRKKMAVTEIGRESVTEYSVAEDFGPFSLVCAFPRTGRTHQIRVHLAHLNCPIVGDPTYGGRKRALSWARQHKDEELLSLIANLSGQALHARRLGFQHPHSGEWVQFEAPVPADMSDLIEYLRNHAV